MRKKLDEILEEINEEVDNNLIDFLRARTKTKSHKKDKCKTCKAKDICDKIKNAEEESDGSDDTLEALKEALAERLKERFNIPKEAKSSMMDEATARLIMSIVKMNGGEVKIPKEIFFEDHKSCAIEVKSSIMSKHVIVKVKDIDEV